ncbi:MAG: 1-deoxy-D-xylulose 5-phosphate reductoisomerase, partial [Actinomycetota bacterium]
MRVAIAGSTGSIGTQTLDVIAALGESVEVVALSVGSSVDTV